MIDTIQAGSEEEDLHGSSSYNTNLLKELSELIVILREKHTDLQTLWIPQPKTYYFLLQLKLLS